MIKIQFTRCARRGCWITLITSLISARDIHGAQTAPAVQSFEQEVPVYAQQAYLKASNTGTNDSFGFSIAASEDIIVVGAHQERSSATGVNGNQNDNSALNAGAAYVFARNGTNWTQQAYLKASNTGANDVFGWKVGVSGDTIVVGASGEDSNATGVNGDQSNNTISRAGAAYVFVRSGTNWNQQAYLKASNPGTEDQFGSSVAISGDTIVVGARFEGSSATGMNGDQSNNSAPGAGAVFVFVRSGTNWTQQAYLKASNTDGGDTFGSSVALSGDTLVVGAPTEDSNAIGVNGNQSDNSARESGSAYVFVRSGTTWTQQAYLKASNTRTNDLFGDPVAISGNTIVVGVYHESSNATGVNGNQNDYGATDSGAAYVFVRDGTTWSQKAYLKASNAGPGDGFGYSVGVSADTVIVGAPGESSSATGVNGDQGDNNASGAGAAYVFTHTGTNWNQQAYLKASNPQAADLFGAAAAMSADTIVIAAILEASAATGVDGNQIDNSIAGSGAAYVFTNLNAPGPQISIERSPDRIRLFWALSAEGFVLDQTSELTSNTNMWSQVPFPYETNATHIFVTTPTSLGSKFYRLRKP
jgi:trimeric autotransporter adhesin